MTCPGMVIVRDVVHHCLREQGHEEPHQAHSLKPEREFQWKEPLVKVVKR